MIDASSQTLSTALHAIDPAGYDAKAAAVAAAATAGFVETAQALNLRLRLWTRPAAGATALLFLVEPALVARPSSVLFEVLSGAAAVPLLWAVARPAVRLVLETPLVRAEAERERVFDRLTGEAHVAAARSWSQNPEEALEGDRRGDLLFRVVAWLQAEFRLKRFGPGEGWRIEKQGQFIYVGVAGLVGVLIALLIVTAFGLGGATDRNLGPVWACRGLAVAGMGLGLGLLCAAHALGDRLARRAGGLVAPVPEALVRAADPRPGRDALLYNMLMRLNALRDYPLRRGLPPECAP